MLFPRLFSPTLNYRLFDPMPLPKRARVRITGLNQMQNRTEPAKKYRSPFSRIIKKIPANR